METHFEYIDWISLRKYFLYSADVGLFKKKHCLKDGKHYYSLTKGREPSELSRVLNPDPLSTRPDTRPPVADGWAGADMRVFLLFDSC